MSNHFRQGQVHPSLRDHQGRAGQAEDRRAAVMGTSCPNVRVALQLGVKGPKC
jgi:hypothetical protein